ncbi:putative metal-binding protein [Flavisolibacter ginsengisoli]|jgi:hypothetical protein|uniref:Predicted metal binding domain-containing protein n=1 Tax=Flavisolibacter ginsengisoli DSM 18119 TaxID=1121884 RepID=A0A1M5BBT2_9BACT|nr:putative metal-binding protein [Flavisolibacter ginsengisoli]SHF40031.1 Predicted metal binding domain-containing protein [Flavisolibacter ginsengisoli DSM 18119]
MSDTQFVDPVVTQQKFTEELERFRQLKEEYRSKGVLLLEEAYPNLYFAFTAPSLNPVPIVFAVCINFINYDVEPLSVRFVHPVTLQHVLFTQMQTRFFRNINGPAPQALLQAQSDQVPFFCIPGVREYHKHTFHNGDSWFLYRKNGGEGSLCFLLDNLQLYGTSAINSYLFQFNFQMPNINLGINQYPT